MSNADYPQVIHASYKIKNDNRQPFPIDNDHIPKIGSVININYTEKGGPPQWYRGIIINEINRLDNQEKFYAIYDETRNDASYLQNLGALLESIVYEVYFPFDGETVQYNLHNTYLNIRNSMQYVLRDHARQPVFSG